MSAADGRDDLRARLRQTRRALDPKVAGERSAMAADVLWSLAGDRDSGPVGAYMAMDGELDPAPFVDRCHSARRPVTLPAIDGDTLRFVKVTAESTLVRHGRGMWEPSEGPAVELSNLDLLVVPAVAVSTDGTRLGFGEGYYDRALSGLSPDRRPLTVALVHPEQLVDHLDRRHWDVPVDAIATPRGLTWTTRPDRDPAKEPGPDRGS